MPVSAILVVGDCPSGETLGDGMSASGVQAARVPLACVETLGQSAAERTIARLQTFAAVKAISIFTQSSPWRVCAKAATSQRGVPVVRRRLDRWLVLRVLEEEARKGFDKVLFIRMGAYVEFDFEDLWRFHLETNGSVTRVHDTEGPLDFWLIDARPSGDTEMASFTSPPGPCSSAPYVCKGYVNRLRDAHDLRRLVVDAFLSRSSIIPLGREIRPGIWVEPGAHVHHSARIVAPAYIGIGTKVRQSALIAKFSNVEHHCEIGPGTAVQGSTVLPYTRLGRALFVNGAVVEGSHLTDLARNLTVEVADQKLLANTAPFKPEGERPTLERDHRAHRPAKIASGSLDFS